MQKSDKQSDQKFELKILRLDEYFEKLLKG